MWSGEDLANVAPGTFDHAIDPRLAAEFAADPRHHLALALEGDLVVSMASGVHYVHPDKPAKLWINEVGLTEDDNAAARALYTARGGRERTTVYVEFDL